MMDSIEGEQNEAEKHTSPEDLFQLMARIIWEIEILINKIREIPEKGESSGAVMEHLRLLSKAIEPDILQSLSDTDQGELGLLMEIIDGYINNMLDVISEEKTDETDVGFLWNNFGNAILAYLASRKLDEPMQKITTDLKQSFEPFRWETDKA